MALTKHVCAIAMMLLGTALSLYAEQEPQGGFGRRGPQFDPAAVERGQKEYVTACGFCHGSSATGGQGGPDLIRSVLVLDDENGKQLGEFLKVGRPDKGMPKFNLTDSQMSDIATFLHSRIAAASNRGAYRILDILTGDAKAGEAYFNGAGRCNACHSVTGDLKGIGSKYDPTTLQGRIIMPRGRGGFRGRVGPPQTEANPVMVTVTLTSGQAFTGELIRVTDFDVTLRDSSGQIQSWLRNGDTPKVEVNDPLKPH